MSIIFLTEAQSEDCKEFEQSDTEFNYHRYIEEVRMSNVLFLLSHDNGDKPNCKTIIPIHERVEKILTQTVTHKEFYDKMSKSFFHSIIRGINGTVNIYL